MSNLPTITLPLVYMMVLKTPKKDHWHIEYDCPGCGDHGTQHYDGKAVPVYMLGQCNKTGEWYIAGMPHAFNPTTKTGQ